MSATTDCAERWLATDAFRWEPGMLLQIRHSTFRVTAVRIGLDQMLVKSEALGWTLDHLRADGAVPVMADRGTYGCLVGQVRELWGDEEIVAQPIPVHSGTQWVVSIGGREVGGMHATEIGALVGAIEAYEVGS